MATSPEISIRTVPAKDLELVVPGKATLEKHKRGLFVSDPQVNFALLAATYKGKPVSSMWITVQKTTTL